MVRAPKRVQCARSSVSSVKRVNWKQGLLIRSSFPVVEQRVSMIRNPFTNQFTSTAREIASDYRPCLDIHNRLTAAVNRVKVGRSVVTVVHVDRDSVELTDTGHRRSADFIRVTAGDDRAAGLDHPLQNGQSAAPGRSPCSGSSMRRPTDQRLPISPAPSYQLESHRTTFRPQSTLNPGVVTATDMGNRLTAEDDAEVRGAGPDGRTPRFSALSAVDVREPTSGDRQQDQSRRRCRTQQWPPVDRPPNDRRLPQAGTQQIRVVLPDDRASLRGPLVPPLRSTSAMRSSAARTAAVTRWPRATLHFKHANSATRVHRRGYPSFLPPTGSRAVGGVPECR